MITRILIVWLLSVSACALCGLTKMEAKHVLFTMTILTLIIGRGVRRVPH